MNELTKGAERNDGIDSLRMLSMLMVVILHLLWQGGVLAAVPRLSIRYFAAWLLECAAYCAVDCYALISGYVGLRSRFRYSRLVQLWLQVVFWTLLITLAFGVLLPGALGPYSWRNALMPFLTGQYWYLTAYFGLFFLTPLLNKAVLELSSRELGAFLAAALVFYSALPRLYSVHQATDPFKLDSGYSVLWLAMLYVAGGFLSKYEIPEKISRHASIAGFCAMVLLTWGSKAAIELLAVRGIVTDWYSGVLVDYTSPTVLLAGVFLVLFFAKADYRPGVVKMVRTLSPAALGVYIIHAHPLIWNYVIKGCAAGFALDHTPVLAAKVLLSALAVYLVCSGAELLRLRLFRLLRVSELCRSGEQRCRAWLSARLGTQ